MSDSIYTIEVNGGVGQHVTDLRDEITRLRAENERLTRQIGTITAAYRLNLMRGEKYPGDEEFSRHIAKLEGNSEEVFRTMTDAEKAECERVTLYMHAAARAALRGNSDE